MWAFNDDNDVACGVCVIWRWALRASGMGRNQAATTARAYRACNEKGRQEDESQASISQIMGAWAYGVNRHGINASFLFAGRSVICHYHRLE